MELKRLFPLSGIVFVALVVLTVLGIGGSTPASDASAADVASFYDDNTVRQFIGAFMYAAAVPFLVLFAVTVADALRTSEDAGSSVWERVLIAGSVLAGGAVLVGSAVHLALVDGAEQEISPTALQALNVLDGSGFIAFTSGLGVMMIGAAGVLISAGVARWLGWAALVLGVALFIPFADFFAMMLTGIWIIVAGVVLVRRPAESRQAIAASAA